MIIEKEITKGIEIPKSYRQNLNVLLERINKFANYLDTCEHKHIPLIVTSGYRSPKHNQQVGGAPRSCHCQCMAVDLRDTDGFLKKWIKITPHVLEMCDLYMEDPRYTPTWVHLDIRKRRNRVFIP